MHPKGKMQESSAEQGTQEQSTSAPAPTAGAQEERLPRSACTVNNCGLISRALQIQDAAGTGWI